jgi:hypothetical protein
VALAVLAWRQRELALELADEVALVREPAALREIG